MTSKRENYPIKSSISRRGAMRALAATFGAVLLATAVGLPRGPAAAQDLDAATYGRLAREGSALSRDQAQALEASLAANPEDLSARAKLLGFYFRGGARLIGYPAAIEARAKHILWLIEHHPDSAIFELSETTIDREGHSLADPAGRERAAAAWIEQARRHDRNAVVLGHAARFFHSPTRHGRSRSCGRRATSSPAARNGRRRSATCRRSPCSAST